MTNGWHFGRRELLGVCIASRWPLSATETAVTWGDGKVRDLEGVDDRNERAGDLTESDRLVLSTHNRVVVAATAQIPGWTGGFRVATHHGFWTRDGATEEAQLESTRRAASFLTRQGREHRGGVYLADINPDKAGRVRAIYQDSGGQDFLPGSVRTTLASDHPAAALGIRSDCVMAWPGEEGMLSFSSVQVEVGDDPGSDHLLLQATFESE
jgi:hypothetical protein